MFRDNGKQSLKLRNRSNKVNNYSKQLALSFKVYADFESVLSGLEKDDKGSNAPYTNNIKNIFLAVLILKPCVLMTNLADQLFFTDERMKSTSLLKQFLRSIGIVNW